MGLRGLGGRQNRDGARNAARGRAQQRTWGGRGGPTTSRVGREVGFFFVAAGATAAIDADEDGDDAEVQKHDGTDGNDGTHGVVLGGDLDWVEKLDAVRYSGGGPLEDNPAFGVALELIET